MSIEELYRSSPGPVRAAHSLETARDRYRAYVDFASAWVPAGARVLDLGCGTGWSSFLLAERGYRVVGADLNARAFAPPPRTERLSFMAASMNQVPAPDGAFDAVCLHEALEHGEDPGQALEEVARVVRPGGVAVIVGPNLLSPLESARALFVYSRQTRPRRRLLVRDPEMPFHPFGNTLPEIVAQLGRNLVRIARKLSSREVELTMRTPDLRPPFHADSDASYLCNPIDLWRFFRGRGFEVLATAPAGRPAWTALIAGGTWLAAKKPA